MKKEFKDTNTDKTQFSIRTETKDELDKFKVKYKDAILNMRQRDKRFITNDDVITFLIQNSKKKL